MEKFSPIFPSVSAFRLLVLLPIIFREISGNNFDVALYHSKVFFYPRFMVFMELYMLSPISTTFENYDYTTTARARCYHRRENFLPFDPESC